MMRCVGLETRLQSSRDHHETAHSSTLLHRHRRRLRHGAGRAGVAVFGTVISSTPVVVQVEVPRRQCVDEPGYVQAPPSGGGAIVGGILGGLAGNAIGAGAGRALATGVGAIAGAVVGNGVEAANTPSVPVTTTRCTHARALESRVIGYDVVYEFDGQRYTTRTARDPGDRIALDLRPAGGSPYDDPARTNLSDASDASGAPVAPVYPVVPAPYVAAPYPYPPPAYGPASYAPSVPVYIEGRFGGRHWRCEARTSALLAGWEGRARVRGGRKHHAVGSGVRRHDESKGSRPSFS